MTMASRTLPLEERFWRRVDQRGPDDCWLWMGGKCGGYGRVFRGGGHRGPTTFAHIVSWELAHPGERIPEGHQIRHTCDVRACVNPAHLLTGTHQDNSDDMVERNRQSKNEQHHNAKLTMDKAREIRKTYVRGSRIFGIRALAEKHNVTPTAVARILRGEAWKEAQNS